MFVGEGLHIVSEVLPLVVNRSRRGVALAHIVAALHGVAIEGQTGGAAACATQTITEARGDVAQLVYEKLKAFNCRFLISDPFYSGKINKNIAKFVPLEQLLENSDVVSLHARLSRKSILLGEEEFKRMKNTAYFINTARSYMVDYDALAGALKTGEIMGAAIDVFDVEPVTKENNPLVGLDNCTLTNHRGGDTINSYSDSPAMMMKEAQKYFEGDTPKYWLNPTVKR